MSDQGMNIKLVGAVEKHEALYNYKLPEYSRKDSWLIPKTYLLSFGKKI